METGKNGKLAEDSKTAVVCVHEYGDGQIVTHVSVPWREFDYTIIDGDGPTDMATEVVRTG